MFKKIKKKILKNPLEALLKKAKKKKYSSFLLAWNRGLGDIPLGLYAIVQRIKKEIVDATITFLIREDLQEGFLLFPEVKTIVAEKWKRGQKYHVVKTLKEKNIDKKKFDVIISYPDPTYWVKWQIGNVIPKLTWNEKYDLLHQKFSFKKDASYLGVQVSADTLHSAWRDWPKKRWEELFQRLEEKKIRILLFGKEEKKSFLFKNAQDLRGKTTLLEMLSIIKNRCSLMVLPDGGILSMLYYLDVSFPIKVVSLWADCQGVLKQKVASPNKELDHRPIQVKDRKMKDILVSQVLKELFS